MNKNGFTPITALFMIALVIVGVAILGTSVYYYSHVAPIKSPGYIPPIGTSTAPIGVATSSPISTSTSTPSSTSTPPTPSSTQPAANNELSPTSGPVGTIVTIHGAGFAATGNMVTMDGMVNGSLNDLSSPDGKTLTFTVPSSLGPNCKPDQACPAYEMLVGDATYAVAVVSNGTTQDVGSFTVTGVRSPLVP